MDGVAGDDARIKLRALIFALVALAFGHMLSTLLRTIPAISIDLMAADFGTSPQALPVSPRSIISPLPPRRFRLARRWTALASGRFR